ncbi:MAG: LysM peptidoglycan-binding domain-containing protein [Solirubrobacterales bacterium]
MPDSANVSRYLAPAALLGAVVAVLVVVGSSLGGSDGGGSAETDAQATTTEREKTSTSTSRTSTTPNETYVVKPGDSFEQISQKTGIPTDDLLERNPDLDPQALISGQRIKLRE